MTAGFLKHFTAWVCRTHSRVHINFLGADRHFYTFEIHADMRTPCPSVAEAILATRRSWTAAWVTNDPFQLQYTARAPIRSLEATSQIFVSGTLRIPRYTPTPQNEQKTYYHTIVRLHCGLEHHKGQLMSFDSTGLRPIVLGTARLGAQFSEHYMRLHIENIRNKQSPGLLIMGI